MNDGSVLCDSEPACIIPGPWNRSRYIDLSHHWFSHLHLCFPYYILWKMLKSWSWKLKVEWWLCLLVCHKCGLGAKWFCLGCGLPKQCNLLNNYTVKCLFVLISASMNQNLSLEPRFTIWQHGNRMTTTAFLIWVLMLIFLPFAFVKIQHHWPLENMACSPAFPPVDTSILLLPCWFLQMGK